MTDDLETQMYGSDGNMSDSADSEEANVTLQSQQAKVEARRTVFSDYLQQSAGEWEVLERSNELDDNTSRTKKIIDYARSYQQELFERALEENVIAVLDTGSGKTLIACLLIRHFLTEERINRELGRQPKIVCFLACSVHLVYQQARVLGENLAVKPAVFVGDTKAEVWKNSEYWTSVIADGTPVVCTPAVLKYCLDAALVRIQQISLIVFDEAHHTKKNHPYSLIIRSHYLACDLDARPKIFGMTASPVDSKGNVDVNMSNLEELLHCKIVTAEDPSKVSNAPKPKDVVWRYGRIEPRQQSELCSSLTTKFSFLPDINKGANFAKHAVSSLGPWCADRVWRYIIGSSEIEASAFVKRLEQSTHYKNCDNVDQRETILRDMQTAIELLHRHQQKSPLPGTIHLSSKVLKLYEGLVEIYTTKPNTRAIVFVEQRFTAQVLKDCFSQLDIPNLRPSVILGAAQDSVSIKKQEKFLSDFRVGIVNLIFATSVAEEGIDIPQCNLCVRFDLYKSPIQYIQSRGRARMIDSIYVHMIEDGNQDHVILLNYALQSDKYIKSCCQQLDPNRLLGRGTKLEQMIALDSTKRSFKTDAGATCDYDNSLIVLNRFVSSLRYIGAVEKEYYEEEIDEVNKLFRYVVRLPALTEVEVSGARGEWRPNKQLAKRSAAWNCCVLLRKAGLLDENLGSRFRKIMPANLNARLAISNQKTAYTAVNKPAIWQYGLGEVPKNLYLSFVNLLPQNRLHRKHSEIVFLTRIPLPSFPSFTVYLEGTVESQVSISTDNYCVAITADEIDILTQFTLEGVFLDVFNKSYGIDGTRLSYWLAPPSTSRKTPPSRLHDVVDVEAMARVGLGRTCWSPGCRVDGIWTDAFVCDPRNGNFHYFTGGIAHGYSIFDPVPSTVPPVPQKGMGSIIDFSDSTWRASKKKADGAYYDPKQPVLSAELLTSRRNYLEPGSGKDQTRIECFIAPQPLQASRLEPAFAASCFAWPSIIHRLESYMIALEAFDKLDIPGIETALALEAFTKDTDNMDDEHQTHLGNRHGMGKNYERLEFLGDSFLKMMTTITVFNRTKCDEAGMHCRRMEILCNRRLFEVSTNKYQLYEYARTKGFSRVTWYPENLILLKGRGAKKAPEPVCHPQTSQDLGMKTIADISEAIIGAAILSSQGLPSRFDLGIKAITKLVDSEDHAITSWAEIAGMYEAPEWSLKMDDIRAGWLAEEVAARTGYRFKYPRLLRSAFTHSSEANAPVPDLQRLEFLGDAVLDWVSISWLFETNPDRNPQWLTEHKMAMVSNKFLAALAVTLDFDKFVSYSSTALFADVTFYAKRVREAYAEKDVDRNFWTHIDSPPKALSDLVESYLGAVLVDSGFNYGEVEKFFHKHVLWFFEDISQYDSFANRHPTTFLYRRITDEFKCHDYQVVSQNTDKGDIDTRVTAGVVIHNKVVSDSSGESAKYAKARACKAALRKLEDMTTEEFRRVFGCNCRLKDNQ